MVKVKNKDNKTSEIFFKKLVRLDLPFKLEIRIRVFWADLIKHNPKVEVPRLKYQGGYLTMDWLNSKSGVTLDCSLERCYWTFYTIGVFCEDSETGSTHKPSKVLEIDNIKTFFKEYTPLQFC